VQHFSFLDGGRNTDEVLQGTRKFKVKTYISKTDSLVYNSEKRSKENEEIFEKFGFLENLHVLDQCEITKQQRRSQQRGTNFECLHFKSYQVGYEIIDGIKKCW
jgi:hypothetical protein